MKQLSPPRPAVAAALFAAYFLALLLPPSWRTVEPFNVYTAFGLMAAGGIVWAWLAAGSVAFAFRGRDWLLLLVLFAAASAINLRPLLSGIPWRGDEDYHIYRTLWAIELLYIRQGPIVLASAGLIVLSVFLAWRRSLLAVPALAVLLLCCLKTLPVDIHAEELLLRYPFLSRWLHMPLPFVAGLCGALYTEFTYRVVPFLCFVLLAWLCARESRKHGFTAMLFLGLGVATMPIVWYYSSILYLEPPAVLLLTLVCLRADRLLSGDPAALRREPAWYALILAGFIKESMFPVLACWLLVRAAVRLFPARGRGLAKALYSEAVIAFCVLFPLMVYLRLRPDTGIVQVYEPRLSNLADAVLYPALLASFFEQFGVFFALFLAGLAVLFFKRSFGVAWFLTANLILVPLFFIADGPQYTGYSRFNLTLLPAVLAGALAALSALWDKAPRLGIILLCLLLPANVLLSPINLDGTKKPFWGVYFDDTAEHYYPYAETIAWLHETHPGASILFAGLSSGHPLVFYFEKEAWHPPFEAPINAHGKPGELADLQAAAARLGALDKAVIVFHPHPKGSNVPDSVGPFSLEKTFSNQAHSLYVYTRRENSP